MFYILILTPILFLYCALTFIVFKETTVSIVLADIPTKLRNMKNREPSVTGIVIFFLTLFIACALIFGASSIFVEGWIGGPNQFFKNGENLVSFYEVVVGLPIALAGSFVAILLAFQAIKISSKQVELETRIQKSDLRAATRKEITQLRTSLFALKKVATRYVQSSKEFEQSLFEGSSSKKIKYDILLELTEHKLLGLDAEIYDKADEDLSEELMKNFDQFFEITIAQSYGLIAPMLIRFLINFFGKQDQLNGALEVKNELGQKIWHNLQLFDETVSEIVNHAVETIDEETIRIKDIERFKEKMRIHLNFDVQLYGPDQIDVWGDLLIEAHAHYTNKRESQMIKFIKYRTSLGNTRRWLAEKIGATPACLEGNTIRERYKDTTEKYLAFLDQQSADNDVLFSYLGLIEDSFLQKHRYLDNYRRQDLADLTNEYGKSQYCDQIEDNNKNFGPYVLPKSRVHDLIYSQDDRIINGRTRIGCDTIRKNPVLFVRLDATNICYRQISALITHTQDNSDLLGKEYNELIYQSKFAEFVGSEDFAVDAFLKRWSKQIIEYIIEQHGLKDYPELSEQISLELDVILNSKSQLDLEVLREARKIREATPIRPRFKARKQS